MKMTQKLRRAIALSFMLVFASTVLLTALRPGAVSAAPYSADSIQRRSEAWLFGRAVGQCFREVALNDGWANDLINADHAESGEWFTGHGIANAPTYNAGTIIGEIVENDPDDGQIECSNPALFTKALEYLGMSAVEALCSMDNFTREHPGSAGESCTGGTGYFKAEHWHDDKIQDAWNSVFREKYLEGKGMGESLTNGMRYWISLETFRLGCRADFKELYDDHSIEGEKKYKTPKYNQETGEIEQWYVETSDGNDVIDVGGNGLFDDDSKQHCGTLEENIGRYVVAYKEEFEALNQDDDPDNDGGTNREVEPTCESEGGNLAWILCPVLSTVFDGPIDFLDKTINNLLFIDKSRYDHPNMDTAWESMRNLALLILVPMMMFMVIGTALNFGPFDPYTVKKALPRMFVAVIFIVLSLPITRFGVMLSNATGQGLGNLIQEAAPTAATSIAAIIEQNFPEAATGSYFAGLAVFAGFATGAISLGILLSLAATTFVALLIGFVILVMRQVLVIMLMVIAPLAILAWIFPGNDKLWAIWKTTFIAMLLMYPIISILLSSGRFVAGLFGN